MNQKEFLDQLKKFTVKLSKESEFNYHFKSVSGNLANEFPFSALNNIDNAHGGAVGHSENQVNVKTVSGDLKIIAL